MSLFTLDELFLRLKTDGHFTIRDRLLTVHRTGAPDETVFCATPGEANRLRLLLADGLAGQSTGRRDPITSKKMEGLGGEAEPRKRTREERWRDPLKSWANGATRSAVRLDILTKPELCECGCGETGVLEAHHPNQLNPLRVVRMLKACHLRMHAAQRRAAE